MTKTFTHVFKSGEVCTLKFHMDSDVPRIESDFRMENASREKGIEFEQWVESVIAPEVVAASSAQQVIHFADHGLKAIHGK